jgi:hypothetical protein
MQICSDFAESLIIIVDDNDSPISKCQDLDSEYFDRPFLSMRFHFLADNTGVKVSCPLSFVLILAMTFFERYLSIVGEITERTPHRSASIIDSSAKEFLSEHPFRHFLRTKS